MGTVPAALEAIERCARELNRYPDGGAYRLQMALAERHGVRFEEVAPGAGRGRRHRLPLAGVARSGRRDRLRLALVSSYVIDAQKMGAEPRLVPLRDHRYDLEAMLDAVGPRTKIVYLCHPNNPTGTSNDRAELDAYFDAVPDHVLTVIDQAYFEYVDDLEYPDAVDAYFKEGRNVLVVRTFSKIYGLAGLRVGYGVGSGAVVRALGKVRRAFDVTTTSQEAALASLDDDAEIERRRRANAAACGAARRFSTATARARRARGGELPLRRPRRGRVGAGRRPAPRGRDRPAAGGLRSTRGGAHHRGDAEDHAVLDGALSAVVGGGWHSGKVQVARVEPPRQIASPACCAATRASGPSSPRRSRRAWEPGSPSSRCRSTSTTGPARRRG